MEVSLDVGLQAKIAEDFDETLAGSVGVFRGVFPIMPFHRLCRGPSRKHDSA